MILLLNRVELARNLDMTHEARIGELKAILGEHPDFYPAWKTLGQTYVGVGDLKHGAEALTKALQLSPGTPRDVFGLAAVRHSQGALDQALALLDPLLQRYPNYLRAHHLYGTILTQQDRWQESLEHFQRVFDSDPDYENWVNMNQLVGALSRTGEIERLRGMLLQHLADNPAATQVRRTLAFHLAQSKEDKQAQALLMEGLDLYPEDTELVNGMASLLISSSDPDVRDLERAERLLKPFAAAGAEVPQLMFTLCALYGQTGRIPDAMELGRKARAVALKNGNMDLVKAFDQRLGQ